jgi:hypothetical protein
MNLYVDWDNLSLIIRTQLDITCIPNLLVPSVPKFKTSLFWVQSKADKSGSKTFV